MTAATVSLALMVAMVIINRLNKKGSLSLLKMLDYGEKVTDFAIVKVVIWGMVELALFTLGMINSCSQGVVVYGFVLILLHATLIFLYLCHKLMTVRAAHLLDE